MAISDSEAQTIRADPVGALLVDCMERISGGDHAAIEELCAAHPQHAGEIRERMGVLLQMGLVEGAQKADSEFPETLGEFKLVRRLGGGGMGVVYEAVQQRLGRTVALKLIRPEHLYFPRARERFRRETESVARLQHPSIVSIYTVGEERGIPYFAMELIRGTTLADVLTAVETRAPESLRGDDLRCAVLGAAEFEASAESDDARVLFDASWTDACVRIVQRIANALSHAHARGVLHRDIKPSNITVAPDGRVVLLDFGLASTKVDMRITTYGSAVGSALYMAPEQLDGRLDEVDARTDVYSLGVTLCELLTLQVPYSGSTTDEIKSAIARGAAPHLRARNYRISRDLENVCLKAIAGDRKLRYASMDDFAADLQRVLDDEPVLARPPSSAVRLLRWVRRHPTGTVAMLLAAVLVFVVPSALYLQQRVHSRELEQSLEAANVARRAADAAHSVAVIERERAQREARDSEVVTKFLVDTFGAANPLNNGGRPATAEELLRQGVERIDTELADQPAQRARLLERMAESFRGLGSYERAGEMAERAVALRRELHGDDDARTGYALGLVGINRRMSGASDQGIAQLTEALATLECSLGPAAPATIDLRLQLAAGLLGINRARDAHWLLERALHDLTVGSPDDVRTRARILLSMAFAQSTGMRWHELYATCCTLLDSETLHQLSQAEQLQTLGLYGGALRELDRLDEAIDVSQEALARAELLYGELHSQPAGFLQALSDCYVARGELQHALDGYRRAFEINLHLQGAEFPAVFRCAVEIVELEMALGRLDAAVRFAEDYSAMLHESLGPDHIRTQYMEWHCAMLRLRCGDVEDALERMLDLQPLRVAQDASVAPRLAGGIALCHWMLGDADAAYGVAYYASGPAPKIEMLALPLSLALAERGELASAITLLESITAGPVDRFTEEWALATCRVLLALLRDREQGAARPSAATTTARRAFERQFGTQQAVYGAIVERYGLD